MEALVQPERKFALSRYLGSELATAAVLVLAMLLAPYDAPPGAKPWLAGVLAILAISCGYIDSRFSETRRHIFVTALQCCAAVALTLIAPQLWHVSVIAVAGICCIHMAVENKEFRWHIFVLSVVALAALALVAEENPVNWTMSLVMAAVVVGGGAFWFEESLKSRNAFLESHKQLLSRARAFSWEIDSNTKEICSVAGNVKGVLGYESAELVGQPFTRFTGDFEAQRVWFEGDERHAVVTALHRDGHEVILHEGCFPQSDDSTLRGVSSDVTEANRAVDALRHQADHDSLTGLINRAALRRQAEHALTAGTGATALLVVDFDRFKKVNDTLGHQTGDKLLQVIGSRFQRVTGEHGVAARMGGDEFAFLLTDTTAIDASDAANRIAAAAEEAVDIDGFALSTSASIGIALAPDHASTYEELAKCADIACYSAKQSGGGVCIYESNPAEESSRRLQLLTEMPQAVRTGEFELFLQPKVSVETGAVVGAEGLSRWRHPEFGLLCPGDFLHTIDLASDFQRFTNEMVRQAIEFVSLASALGSDLHVAINVGSMSLRDESLPGRVRLMLDGTGVDGSLLTFEVIETDLVVNDPLQQQVLRNLAALGIQISIDGFGAGFSNFSELKKLGVDEVKIEPSYIKKLGESSTDLAVVESMIGLARKLGYRVVAKGVEHASQVQILSQLGCELAQGHYYARPMPEVTFLARLDRGALLDREE